MTTLENNVKNIYKEHNALVVEEKLKEFDLKYDKNKEGYTYSNGVGFVCFDKNGMLKEATIEIPESISLELQKRIIKSSSMLKSIWKG